MIKPVSTPSNYPLRNKIDKFLGITTNKIRNEVNYDKKYDVFIACQNELGDYLSGRIDGKNIFALKK